MVERSPNLTNALISSKENSCGRSADVVEGLLTIARAIDGHARAVEGLIGAIGPMDLHAVHVGEKIDNLASAIGEVAQQIDIDRLAGAVGAIAEQLNSQAVGD